jgi:16S rRNA (adenine1518-N6/adenine1519-N6)-dimethyltransferase
MIDQHFMLQREVVDRMVAAPGSGDYSRLSVMLQYRYAIEKIFDVAPEAFDPAPRVTSSIVRMVPLPDTRARAIDEPLFAAVVLRAFSQRRKMLRTNLQGYSERLALSEAELKLRAQDIPVTRYIEWACRLAQPQS